MPMEYKAFFENFGGSARTKHIAYHPDGRTDLPRALYRQIRNLVTRNLKERSKRRFAMPMASGLPKDFIRLDPWEMEYVYMIASHAKKGIVEIGRWNGGSVFLMSCSNDTAPIWSIDIAPQSDDRLRGFFKQYNVGSNVNLIVGDSQHTKYPQIKEYDFVFIDGDHSYEGCKADIENWYPGLADGGHVLFHDTYFGSHGVQRAVCEFLQAHPELQVIKSPYIAYNHWNYPAGSLAHFIKRGK